MFKLWVSYQEEVTQLTPVPLLQPLKGFSATLVAPGVVQLCRIHTWTWAHKKLLKDLVAHLFLYQKVQMESLVCSLDNCAGYQIRFTHTRLRFNLLLKQVGKHHLDLTGQNSFYLLFLYLDIKSWMFISGKVNCGGEQKDDWEVNEIHSGATKAVFNESCWCHSRAVGGPALLYDTEGADRVSFMRRWKYSGICFPPQSKGAQTWWLPRHVAKEIHCQIPREGKDTALLLCPESRVEMLGSWFLAF